MHVFSHKQEMIERHLKPRGIDDPAVLHAMAVVPREAFVPESLMGQAYADKALSIGFGQTISQPFTVAFMCQSLLLQPEDRVLEIGTGSGYGAAVLSRIASEVHSIERLPELAAAAAERIRSLGYHNVRIHTGDGTRGLPEFGPFDAICVTAAGTALPDPFIDQLAEGGRILIPLADDGGQTMYRFTKRNGRITREDLGRFAFVPLIGEYGYDERHDG